jgi:parallel beta-helix repeat protein
LASKGFIILIVASFLLNNFIIAPQTVIADTNPPVDMGNGWWNTTAGSDWTINTTGNFWENKNIKINNSLELLNGGNLTLQNCSVIIEGNITVGYNSSLRIINTTLKFNSTVNGSSRFLVNSGGSLVILDYDQNTLTNNDSSLVTSNITNNLHRFIFFVSSDTNFTMKNSRLHQCGFSESPNYYGLYIQSDNCTIENNTFTENYAGIIIESSDNSIKNNEIQNNDEYGLLMILGEDNKLMNNTIQNNSYNFGLLIDEINQTSHITHNNMINGNEILYLEDQNDQNINASNITAGFVGIVNGNNISISGFELHKNFNSILLYYVNDSKIADTNLTNNYYGIFSDNVQNFSIIDSSISNNDYVGIEFIGGCKNFSIINCSFENNLVGIRVSDSNITIINTTLENSIDNEMYVKGDSYVCAINCTLNTSSVRMVSTNSRLIGKYYLNIRTMNHTGYPIGDVPVTIYDHNNITFYNGSSDTNGFINWIQCPSYELTKNGLNSQMANYRIEANYAGMNFIQYLNISGYSVVNIQLNHPPEIINLPPATIYVLEDSIFNYDFDSYDKDNDSITWNLTTNATWLDPIEQSEGKITGIPVNKDVGIFFANVSCNDSYLGWTYYNFTIIVNNTNDQPKIITTTGCTVAFEDCSYIFDFNVSDPDKGDVHNWSMKTDAGWIFPIHKSTGRVFGYPYQKHVGSYFVNVSCADQDGAFDFFNFTLEVYPTNDPPRIIDMPEALIKVYEDAMFYYDFEYTDPDKDQVTWRCDNNASWLNKINSSTGELTGIPRNEDVGKFYVNVSCQDPAFELAYYNFTIQVRNTNDPPSFKGEYPTELFAFQDEIFEYKFKVDDPDRKDSFIFSLTASYINDSRDSEDSKERTTHSRSDLGKHTWVGIEHEPNTRVCTIIGIPGNDDVGRLKVNLSVEDSGGKLAYIQFKIIVNNVNDDPVIANPEPSIVFIFEDNEYYHDFDYVDLDGDEVRWSLKTNALWLWPISETTGELFGIPTQDNVGIQYFVEVSCIDPFNGISTQNYTIFVNNTNDPPIISNPCSKIVYVLEDEYYEYDFEVVDRDSKNLYWESQSNASWLEPINLFTGEIFGTPRNIDVGQYFVNISCRDEEYNYTNWNYSLIVNNTNDEPKITNSYLVPISINSDEQYYFKFKYLDPDGDNITWSIETNATGWLEVNNKTGTISGTPGRFEIGSYYVNVTCKDRHGTIDFLLYYIQVQGIYNRPPELSEGHVEPKIGYNNTIFTFFVSYKDPDNDEPYAVIVKIDDIPYQMEQISDTNITDGIIFKFSIKLFKGNHSYYFQALDSLYRNAVVYDFTPTYERQDIISITDKPIESEPRQEFDQLWYFVIILILVELMIGFFVIYRKHKRKRRLELLAEPIQLIEVQPLDLEPRDLTEEDLIDDKSKKPKHGLKEIETKPKTTGSKKKKGDRIKVKGKKGKGKVKKGARGKDDESRKPRKEAIDEIRDSKVEPEQELEGDGTILDASKQDDLTLMVCPECGEFITGYLDTCPGCGVSFVYDQEVQESGVSEEEFDFSDDQDDIDDQKFERIKDIDEMPVSDDMLEDDTKEIDSLQLGSGSLDLMVCPECGQFVNETYNSCPGCGVDFVFDNSYDNGTVDE